MIVTDITGRIQMVNDAFCNMFGYSREEIIGNRTTFLRSEYSTPDFYKEMWNSLGSKGEWRGEIVNRRKDGTEVICFLTISPIYSNAGEKLGYLGVEIDLTERKRMEDQLLMGEKLSAIGEAVATLAHEIRNPLNGIRMNLYMLEQARKDQAEWTDDDTESLELISKETERLQAMVTSVLSYARSVEISFERVLVSELMSDIMGLLHYDAEGLGVALEVAIDEDPMTVRCDADLIKQVLLNLVRNAIEAAAIGTHKKVLLSARHDEGERWSSISSTGRVVVFEVFDTGGGITSDNQEKLFKPFFSTKSTGLGLGLASSAKIVRQHHGLLEVYSPCPNAQGIYNTQFVVALPA